MQPDIFSVLSWLHDQRSSVLAVYRLQETLTYAALLRLPGPMKREDKLQRVQTVVEALGLGKSVDTIIGKHMLHQVVTVSYGTIVYMRLSNWELVSYWCVSCQQNS